MSILLKERGTPITTRKEPKPKFKEKHYALMLRQQYPLWMLEHFTDLRIKQWYDYWEGQIYVSISGKDSASVLLHKVRKLFPDVPGVFVDTGLEYPEIKEHIKTLDNVVWMRPKMNFKQVIEKYGYPIISKLQARAIRDVRNSTPNMRRLRLEGIKKDGTKAHSSSVLSKKWRYLVDADFKISEQCCDVLKKEPLRRYSKESGRVGMTGMMVDEGGGRSSLVECNAFNKKEPLSSPLLFWKESDVWEYIKKYNVSYATTYDKGERRTGCMFCGFGIQMETRPNRFDRMKIVHPKEYNACMFKLGMEPVLEAIYAGMEPQRTLPFSEVGFARV